MEIRGRQVTGAVKHSKFVVQLSPGKIRIDDANNLEFWMEIQLTKEELEQLCGVENYE